MTFHPIRAHEQQYREVLEELKQFEQNRHCLVIKLSRSGAMEWIPGIEQNKGFFQRLLHCFYQSKRERQRVVTDFTIRFFEINRDQLKKNVIESMHVLGMISAICFPKKEYRERINQLLDELETECERHGKALLEQVENEAQKSIQESITKQESIFKQTQEESQAMIYESEDLKKSKIREFEWEEIQLITKMNHEEKTLVDQLEEETKQLRYLEKTVEIFHDTVLWAAEGKKITTNFKNLKTIPYFQQQKGHITPSSILEKDKKTHPNLIYSFDLKEYSEEVVRLLLNFIDDSSNFLKGVKEESLIELYVLGHFLHEEKLKEKCLEKIHQIQLLDHRKAVQLLSLDMLSVSDPLAQMAHQIVANEFKEVAKKENFKKIAPLHMLAILKRDDVKIESEYEAFKILKSWALQIPGKDLSLILNYPICGERLIDHIRFENFTADEFQQFSKENVLYQKDFNTWSNFFLGDKESIPQLRPIRGQFIVKNTAQNWVSIEWRLPREAFDLPTDYQSPFFIIHHIEAYLVLELIDLETNGKMDWWKHKSGKRRWMGCRSRLGQLDCHYTIRVGNEEEKVETSLLNPTIAIGRQFDFKDFKIENNQLVIHFRIQPLLSNQEGK
jgi:hypothetical protein